VAQNYVEVKIKASDEAKPDLEALKFDLDAIGAKVETAKIEVDDKDAAAKLLSLNARLADLNRKVANPKIKVDGAARAAADILFVEHELDKLTSKEGDVTGKTGALSSVMSGLGSALSGVTSSIPLLGDAGPALVPILAAVTALVPEVVAVGSGFAAAGAGAAAFGLLAMPAIKQVEGAYTGLHAAQQKYQQALALDKIDPTKGHATAVKAALDQLKLVQDALGKLPEGEQKAVEGLDKLMSSFGKMARAFEPQAFKIFADGLKVVNDLLPALTPMANAFVNALHPMMAQLDGFFRSTGFQQWLRQFTSLIGPATTAIGHGIAGVVSEFGKLLVVFSGKDVAHGINIAFDIIKGAIHGVIIAIDGLKTAWDKISQNSTFKRLAAEFKTAWDEISTQGKKKPDFSGLVTAVKDAVSTAIAWLNKQLTPLLNSALTAAANWLQKNASTILVPVGTAIMQGLIAGIKSQLPNLLHVLANVATFIIEHKGPIDADRLMLVPHGQAIMDGLMAGMRSRFPALKSQLADVSALIGNPMANGVTAMNGIGVPGGGQLQLQVSGGSSAFEQFMVMAIRNYVRVRGGSVQSVLGH
jgi:hypothetical protein